MALRPLSEVCVRETEYAGGGRRRKEWWHQEATKKKLRATLEDSQEAKKGGGDQWGDGHVVGPQPEGRVIQDG